MSQARGDDLIRANRSVARFSINNVVETARLFVPELLIETRAHARGRRAVLAPVVFKPELARETFHDAQGVVPERLNLDGLAGARRYLAARHPRVHPSQLHALFARGQKPVPV